MDAEVLRWKEEGNSRFRLGEYEDSVTAYTKGLASASGMIRGDLLSNRAAAYMALKAYPEAAVDASAAASIFLGPAAGSAEPPSTPEPAGGPKSSTKSASAAAATGISPAPPPSAEHCKKAAKAFARLGAAREAANERVAAVRAFRRAYELDGSTERCDSLAEAIASVFSSVRCVSGRRTPLRPGEAWRPGDLAADIEPGGYELLLELAAAKGPKWELARVAAVVSLAGAPPLLPRLAECPQHREAFVRQGGGVLALAEAASSIDHYRLPLPPRVADAWRRRCGAPYEASSLLLAAATGLANLTKHRTCLPADLDLGPRLLAHRPIHVAAAHIVARAANCNASQEAVGTLYKFLVSALSTPQQLDTFVELGGQEALEAMAAREELEGRTAMRNAVWAMMDTVRKHPQHPCRRTKDTEGGEGAAESAAGAGGNSIH